MQNYKHDWNILNMTLYNVCMGAIGIALGLSTNYASNKIAEKYGMRTITKIGVHMLICAFVLAFINLYVSSYFGWTWQNIIPGLFFVAFFFGVQYHIFDNILSLYKVAQAS